MARGRPPKSNSQKILDGNPGNRPLTQPPKPIGTCPPCPSDLKGPARKEWLKLSAPLHQMGILHEQNASPFRMYCFYWGQHVELSRYLNSLRAEDMTVKSSRGDVRAIPQVKMCLDATNAAQRLANEFGITPKSRAAIIGEATEKPPEALDAAEAFLRQPRIVA